MMIVLFFILGAAWRFADGLDAKTSHLPTGVRSFLLGFLLFFAVWSSGAFSLAGGLWLLPCVITMLSLMTGQTKWAEPWWQFWRFAIPGALAVIPAALYQAVQGSGPGLPLLASGCLYALACGAAGTSYTFLGRIDAKLPRWWLFDGFESYARLVLGGVLVGGLAAL